MNDLFYVLLIYLIEFPFPYLGTGTPTLGIWHDELMHTVGLFEAAFLTSTFSDGRLVQCALQLPPRVSLPLLGHRDRHAWCLARRGEAHGGLSEASILVTSSF